MKTGYTYIAMLIDRSGSMHSMLTDAIGGFNAFIAEQKALPGKADMTLAQFDNDYELCFENLDIQSVPDLTTKTYIPRGGTALRDAFHRLMVSTGAVLEAKLEDERPENVIFVVITDGAENSSREISAIQLKELIDLQTKTYNWKFLFLGANMDAGLEGAKMGVKGLTFKAGDGGILRSASAASAYVGNSRTGNVRGAEAILKSTNVDDEEVQAAVRNYKQSIKN